MNRSLLYIVCLAIGLIQAGASSLIETTYLEPSEYTDFEFRERSSKSGLKSFDRELKESKGLLSALGPERRLKIAFYDIDLAGRILPAPRYDETRIVRNAFPPKLSFKYSLLDGEGAVLLSGEESITDLSFLQNLGRKASSETFFYELELLEQWLEGLEKVKD